MSYEEKSMNGEICEICMNILEYSLGKFPQKCDDCQKKEHFNENNN